MGNTYGHFLWAASDVRSNQGNQSSYLYSEILLAYQYQGGACLTFNYVLTGLSTLNVYSRERPTGENTSLLWTMNQDQGNQWFQEQIDVAVVANDFEVKRIHDVFS